MFRIACILSLALLEARCGTPQSSAKAIEGPQLGAAEVVAANTRAAPAVGRQASAPTPSAATSSEVGGSGLIEDFYVEAAQADVIRVDELVASTLEAHEFRSPKIESTHGFPLPKEQMMGRRLEGNVIEARKLVAYNIRANIIEARHIIAKQSRTRKAPFQWAGSNPAVGQVRNRLIEVPRPAPEQQAKVDAPASR